MSTQMNIVLPQTGQTVKVEVSPFFYDIVRPASAPYELFVMGGGDYSVRAVAGGTVLHCADHDSAQFIADALNFYSRAIVLKGN